MTILSAHTARQLRNASMSALYRVAYDHDVDLSDVMASITPSQPIPQAPAARMPDKPSSGMQADDTAPQSSATQSEPQPTSTPAVQEQDDAPVDPAAPSVPETSQPGAEGSVVPASDTGKSVEPSGSAAPAKRISHRQRVKDCHEAHPDWGAAEIAAELDMSKANVWSIASQVGIQFASRKKATTDALRKAVDALPAKPQEPLNRAGPPTPRSVRKQPPAGNAERKSLKQRVAETYRDHPDWSSEQIAEHLGAKLGSVSHALHDARAAAGTAAVEVIPPATPQTPVAPPPTGERRTLTERVRAVHQQHPTWTASLIAKELGANPNSVSTVLSQVRGKTVPAPPNEPEFSGRREMVDHYGAIAKRLRKPS